MAQVRTSKWPKLGLKTPKSSRWKYANYDNSIQRLQSVDKQSVWSSLVILGPSHTQYRGNWSKYETRSKKMSSLHANFSSWPKTKILIQLDHTYFSGLWSHHFNFWGYQNPTKTVGFIPQTSEKLKSNIYCENIEVKWCSLSEIYQNIVWKLKNRLG